MKSILHELYYGKISPWEKPYEYDSEQRKIIENLDKKEKELLELLNENEKVLFEEIRNMPGRLGEQCSEAERPAKVNCMDFLMQRFLWMGLGWG